MPSPIIMLAAGGTGGHVCPALAVAEEIAAQAKQTALLVCDERGARWLGSAPKDLHYYVIPTARLSNIQGLLSFACAFVKSLVAVRKIIKENRPHVVVGFGGYPALPVLLNALVARIPFIIHEQNSVLGRVNRLFAPAALHLALSFPNTRGVTNKLISKAKITGIPVRHSFNIAAKVKKKQDNSTFRILVLGGSQGAEILSRLTPQALSLLPEEERCRLWVTQQARPELVTSTIEQFEKYGIKAEVESFFDNVPQLIMTHDIIIARAGASTIAEITTLGAASILVPYAAAKDNHQYYNAQYLCNNNAALLMLEAEAKPERLVQLILELMQNKGLISTLRKNSKKLAYPNAAASLCKLLPTYQE